MKATNIINLKDITLVGAWALCGIWMPDGPLRITVAAGVASACIGFVPAGDEGEKICVSSIF